MSKPILQRGKVQRRVPIPPQARLVVPGGHRGGLVGGALGGGGGRGGGRGDELAPVKVVEEAVEGAAVLAHSQLVEATQEVLSRSVKIIKVVKIIQIIKGQQWLKQAGSCQIFDPGSRNYTIERSGAQLTSTMQREISAGSLRGPEIDRDPPSPILYFNH